MEKLNVVVLTDDMDLRILVKNLIPPDSMVISGYSDFSSSAMLKIESMYPDVVLCAIKGEVENRHLSFIQNLFCTVVGCVIILITDSVSVDLVNQAARVGIRQVVDINVDAESLVESINIAAQLERQRSLDQNLGTRTRSRTIGFFGGKGGTGKTTLAVNTAVALAKKNKRVLLIDCDLQFGDVNLLLDLEPKDTIVELVQERGGITIDNIKSFSMVHSSGLSVLCAPKSAELADLVSAKHIETIIDVSRPYFDFLVLDLPPTFNDVSIAAIENSDEVMLVYNLEILSLKNAKVCLQIFDQLQQMDKANLVINKSIKSLILVKDFENMFEKQVYAIVANDIKVATACLNKGQPLVIASPKASISKDISAIAQKLLRKTE